MNYLVKEMIRIAIQEDLGHSDVTSLLIVPEDMTANARIIAKEDFILAGTPFVREVFSCMGSTADLRFSAEDGRNVKRNDIIADITGNARDILACERIALNILQRVSGIATLTNSYVERVLGLPVRITDTRKTTPGMRTLEKYGVRVGGGLNHRFGLYDGVLIKDNHIKVSGGIRKAVELAKIAHHLMKIEVEVKDADELNEALDAGADIIMLDNMSLSNMREAVKIVQGRVFLEASGNISLENVREVAETGVDIISIGALTHSARSVDISMKIV